MAIKERKQITGTTAQIQAYAGHEGQIVWDKEKKTFVGMSGTAGKNYPLAPKEYVDNEVAKCLPLTGGLLSGDLNLDPNFGDGNVNVGFNFNDKTGSGIGFRSINYTKSPGAFSIYARDSTQLKVLDGYPDGTLTWDGRLITYITSSGLHASSGNYVRYADGIQICAWQTRSDNPTMVLSYPVPFLYVFATVVDHPTAYSIDWDTTKITITSKGSDALDYFSYLAIGRWK